MSAADFMAALQDRSELLDHYQRVTAELIAVKQAGDAMALALANAIEYFELLTSGRGLLPQTFGGQLAAYRAALQKYREVR